MNQADYQTLLLRAAAPTSAPSLTTAVAALRACLTEIPTTPARRADLPHLMEPIIWPVRGTGILPVSPHAPATPAALTLTPFHLSLDKEDLIRRLWKADGAHDDDTYTEFSEYRIIFYVALHTRADFAPYRANIPALLEQVYAFSEAQITTDAERLLMISAAAAYFSASRATHAVPAPAPFAAFDSGNAPGLTGNTQPGQS